MPLKTVLLLAPGYEELEAVAIIDILRRASIKIVVAGTIDGPVPSARNVKIVPDVTLDEIIDEPFDFIILPGGIDGTENLAGDERVVNMLKKQIDDNKGIGAICAAPTLFDRHGLSTGKTITCHPICRNNIKHSNFSDQRVVVDDNIITSQGPGTAVEFALQLVKYLAGTDTMLAVNKGVLAKI